MPPKPKFTKEQIVEIALQVVAEKGIDALTAKELSHALGTSTSPIFTVFSSMQEVAQAVRVAAMRRFEGYAAQAERFTPAFKQVGMQMILFAQNEPKLYQLCFMSPEAEVKSFSDIYDRLGDVALRCIDFIRRDYALAEADARRLFEHVWIYTFGVGALCATGVCRFSEAELGNLLTTQFQAMMGLIKAKK